MNSLEKIDLSNKKVLLRIDLDVPIKDDQIVEAFRIEKQKPMIDYLISKGARVVMISHNSSIDSFGSIIPQIEKILGYQINFVEDLDNRDAINSNLTLLDNVRRWPEEKENDKEFAKKLAQGNDLYINNCFAVSHRAYSSVSAIAEFLPSYPGFLVQEEISQLEKITASPKEGKVIIMGGAKAQTKVPVVKNFLNKSEAILVGGVIANDILKERGVDIDGSVADENSKELLEGLDINDKRLILPEDFHSLNGKILDIGPKSIASFSELIGRAKMIIWNGPMGRFEDDNYSLGTNSIAKAIVSSGGLKVIGGGDTITAVNKIGLLDKFDFVSTGGGAMLAFLAGDKLPGLEALGYYR